MGLWDKIFFNPNLNHNDSLSPEEIEDEVDLRNRQTRDMAKKAYETGGVPESSARRAADHSSTTRQTNEAKKARRDAETWYDAKASQGSDSDCRPTMHLTSTSGQYNWEDDDDE
ncbi:hypothetical protein QT972_18305 [Microcoleus sp. herbarium7]|uniref:hypothetical protein n=1 Tax=Microcoleus sp. herbarium7 TaxID=3055435 RepID=UPI002FD1D811